MGEAGRVLARGREIKSLGRLKSTYGGRTRDWTKRSSSQYVGRDGMRQQTHWYQNRRTGQRVEYKTKMTWGS